MSTFNQRRGLANLLQVLLYLRDNEVSKEQVQKMIDMVYEGGGE